jgi:hypothetical protein
VLLHLGRGSLLQRIRRILGPLAVLAGLTVAYLAIYLSLARGAEEDLGPVVDFRAGRGVSASLDFFWRGLGELFAPGLLGGPWGTMPLQNNPFIRPPALVAVASVALVVAIVVWAVRRHRETWLPLLMATSYTVVSLALVLYSRRFDVLGTTAINDERYVVDAFAMAVLAGVMVMGSPRRRTPPRGSTPRARRAAGVVVVALAVSLVAGNVAAVARIGTHPGKAWVDNLRAGLQREAPVGLLDTYAPDRVLPPSYWADDARLSRMLSPLGSDVGFGGPVDQLWTVDDDGHVEKVVVDEAVRSEPGPTPDCGYAIAPGQSVTAPMSDQLFALDWVVQVNTLAAEGGPLTIDLGDQDITLVAGPGLGQYQFAYRGEVPATIRLSMSPNSGTTCVTDVIVGTVKAPED